MEEVARRDHPSSGSPDTDNFRRKIKWVYLEKQQICLADNLIIVSEEHIKARRDDPSSGSPYIDVFRKKFKLEYCENR